MPLPPWSMPNTAMLFAKELGQKVAVGLQHLVQHGFGDVVVPHKRVSQQRLQCKIPVACQCGFHRKLFVGFDGSY